jgi:hypothetical protein
MKKTSGLVLACLLAAVGTGCTSRPASPAKPAQAPVEARRGPDPTQLVAEQLRQASEPAHFADLLTMLNPVVESAEVQSRLHLADQQRAFLRKEANLTDDELAEVEATSFRPADAHYLQECFLLRDAAHALEVRGAGVPEQARLCCRWVARNVVLHEQGDDWLPNVQVLRRGYGGPRARALIFLALMRQFQLGKGAEAGEQSTEGCVLVVPGPAPAPVLAALLDPGDQQLYLFDLRLGEPVLNQGGKIATLKDVQETPALLERSGVTPAQVKELQAWLACPLAALSPRIVELENILVRQDRIKLALNAQALQGKLARASSLPVQVWNGPPEQGKLPNSPTRQLRFFLPVEEGGVDRSVPPRQVQFNVRLLPRLAVNQGLEQLVLTSQDLAKPAARFLNEKLITPLLVRYYRQPHEFLLRGQYETMFGSFDRLRPFLEDESVIAPEKVKVWRDRANALAVAAASDPRVREEERAFWAEDQYLGTLLAENDEAAEKFKKAEKGTLTRILAFVCREPLLQRVSWLEACCKQELAERAQAVADASPGGTAAPAKVNKTWLNARGAWNFYLGRINLGPSGLRQRLAQVATAQRNNDPERALSLLEALQLDLQRYYAAKVYLGEVTGRLEGPKTSESYGRSVSRELDDFLAKADAPDGLKQALARAQQVIDNVPNPAARSYLQQRAELLARDWAEQGAFATLRQRFRRLQEAGKAA